MATTSKKMMITDVFVNGAFQGWNIATHSTIPKEPLHKRWVM